MLRRDNTPLSTRVPTLETSAQAQIDDLVQRNRALEQTNKKLTDQLTSEQRRAKNAVADIQKQLHREQREWREGCDVLVSSHRLAHLRTVAELETAKRKVLQEEKDTRLEKVQRLQRDIRILMFQIREGELEDRIAELEEEREDTIARYEQAMANLRRKLSTLAAERKAKAARILALGEENDQIQDKVSQLRQEYTTLQTSAETNATKLERTTLQLKGAQVKNTELEHIIDELKRSNVELRRQLEKWQDLETKGNGEMETLRRQKIELEAKVSNLQDRLQKQVGERDKELEKLGKREEKMKDLVAQWKDEAEEHRSQTEKADEALAEARKRIRQLENELKTISSSRNGDDRCASDQPTKPSGERSRSPSQSKKAKRSRPDGAASTSDTQGSSQKTGRRKPKNKLSPVSEAGEVSDAPPQKAERASKEPNRPRKASKSKPKASPKQSETEDDQDQDDQEGTLATSKGKRRRKASSDDDNDIEVLENRPSPAKKAKNTKGKVSDEPAKGRKVAQRTKHDMKDGTRKNAKNDAQATEADDGSSEPEQAPLAKKKRKINIFSNPAEPTFAFMGNDVDLGLNIPTTLSPVKEVAGIPSRSTSASVMSRAVSRGFLKR
ncbi:hypothetical protein AX15_004573 [Amanita polypyramis BW_CC]|nr:hypothetical protein AX15_004573 [Amanita polypyramis BW_CC]